MSGRDTAASQNPPTPPFCKGGIQRGFKGGGFTILELVVAIFLIAIVLGTALFLMASNLNVIDKANDLLVANALKQYTFEDVRNIDFPPVYYDRQSYFGDRIIDTSTTLYKAPETIVPADDGNDWTPPELQDKYIVRKYDFRYDNAGTPLDDPINPDTDLTMMHRVDVYVLKRKDNSLILTDSLFISRDGMF